MRHGFAGLQLRVPVGAYAPQANMVGVAALAAAYAPWRARILDVGCGVGSVGLAVASFRSDVSVLGLDINKVALSAAWRNARTLQLRNVRFVACDLYSALRPLGFDMVLNTLPYEPPTTYDPADLAEVPHAYADDREVFGTSLVYAPAHAPMLVLFGLPGFADVLVSLNYEVLATVPDDWGATTFVARQKG